MLRSNFLSFSFSELKKHINSLINMYEKYVHQIMKDISKALLIDHRMFICYYYVNIKISSTIIYKY